MKRIALETFYGGPMKEASGRPPPSAEPLSIQLHIRSTLKIFPGKLSLNLLLFAILLAFIFIGVFFRWEALQSVYLNVWVTRDIDRSINLLEGNYFPLGGPETNVGGRLPGPMLYLLILIAFFVSLYLLYKFNDYGRQLFIVTNIIMLIFVFSDGYVVFDSFDYFLDSIATALVGFTIAISYFSSLSKEFKKKK